jgi:hypothetical protein
MTPNWSGRRDSNPCIGLGKPALYRLSYARVMLWSWGQGTMRSRAP